MNRRLVLAGLLTRFHFACLPTHLANKGSGIAVQKVKETYSCGHSPRFSRDSLFIFFGSLPKKNQLRRKGINYT